MVKTKRFHGLQFGFETWMYIVLALSLGIAMPKIGFLFPEWISRIDKSTLTSILSAIASGMITLSGLVFSLVFVLVQFGSAAYSPRITRIFAHTFVLRHSLGIFTGTFLFSLMALRSIGMEQTETVSGLPVWIAFAWLLASIAILARLIHVFTSITVTNVLSALGKTGRTTVTRIYGAYTDSKSHAGAPGSAVAGDWSGESTERRIIYEGKPVYVNKYDTISLVILARKADIAIYLPLAIGDSLHDGHTVARIRGINPAVRESGIYRSITLGPERAFNGDPKYAIRLLVDTAIRALSPAINDPTTAVQALDHIESLLHRLGNSNLDIGEMRDENGDIRLVYKTPQWQDFLQLGLSEIMQYGAASVQVERRLEALLRFLARVLPPERVEAVERFREQRKSIAEASFPDALLRSWANEPDPDGIGGGLREAE